MKTSTILIIFVSVIVFSSCNKTSLNNDEASTLLKEVLHLPYVNSTSVGMGSVHLKYLENEGYFITNVDRKENFLNSILTLNVTEKGQPFYLGKRDQQFFGADYYFKTSDIDLNEITGISIDKESKTAIVRFSLKITNVTPIGFEIVNLINEGRLGNALYPSSKYYPPQNRLIIGELFFRMFDNGWQVEFGQNNTSDAIIFEMLKGNKNSTLDTSQNVSEEKLNEISKGASNNNESQAKFTDINEFLNAFKKAVKSKNKKEISKFMYFPFEADNGTEPAKTIEEVDSRISISSFDVVLTINSLQKYGDNDYGIPGTSLKFSEHSDGYWKLDAAYGSPDFER